MKHLLRIAAVLLLAFNGIGALYGGGHLLSDPSGDSLQMPLHYLSGTPFKDYFIPGLILFIANGIGSMLVLILMFMQFRYYAWLILAEGAILSGWIAIQVWLLQIFSYQHWVLGITGLLLIACGLQLIKIEKRIQQSYQA